MFGKAKRITLEEFLNQYDEIHEKWKKVSDEHYAQREKYSHEEYQKIYKENRRKERQEQESFISTMKDKVFEEEVAPFIEFAKMNVDLEKGVITQAEYDKWVSEHPMCQPLVKGLRGISGVVYTKACLKRFVIEEMKSMGGEGTIHETQEISDAENRKEREREIIEKEYHKQCVHDVTGRVFEISNFLFDKEGNIGAYKDYEFASACSEDGERIEKKFKWNMIDKEKNGMLYKPINGVVTQLLPLVKKKVNGKEEMIYMGRSLESNGADKTFLGYRYFLTTGEILSTKGICCDDSEFNYVYPVQSEEQMKQALNNIYEKLTSFMNGRDIEKVKALVHSTEFDMMYATPDKNADIMTGARNDMLVKKFECPTAREEHDDTKEQFVKLVSMLKQALGDENVAHAPKTDETWRAHTFYNVGAGTVWKGSLRNVHTVFFNNNGKFESMTLVLHNFGDAFCSERGFPVASIFYKGYSYSIDEGFNAGKIRRILDDPYDYAMCEDKMFTRLLTDGNNAILLKETYEVCRENQSNPVFANHIKDLDNLCNRLKIKEEDFDKIIEKESPESHARHEFANNAFLYMKSSYPKAEETLHKYLYEPTPLFEKPLWDTYEESLTESLDEQEEDISRNN